MRCACDHHNLWKDERAGSVHVVMRHAIVECVNVVIGAHIVVRTRRSIFSCDNVIHRTCSHSSFLVAIFHVVLLYWRYSVYRIKSYDS